MILRIDQNVYQYEIRKDIMRCFRNDRSEASPVLCGIPENLCIHRKEDGLYVSSLGEHAAKAL